MDMLNKPMLKLYCSDEFIVLGCFYSIGFRMYIQFVVYILDMRFHCFQVYEQFLGYAFSAFAGSYLFQYLCFPAGEW